MRSIFNDAYAMVFSVFFIESYVVDTCLNCLDNICLFHKEVDKSTLGVIF